MAGQGVMFFLVHTVAKGSYAVYCGDGRAWEGCELVILQGRDWT